MRFFYFITTISAVTISACSSNRHSEEFLVQGNSVYYDSEKPKIEKQKVGVPYQINGKWYTPEINHHYNEVGIASWYGPGFHGKSTANGERFDQNKISAAHTTLPLPSYVEVTNLDNGKKLYVRVNDRGPFADDRIIDLSQRAAELLGSKQTGLAKVRVKVVEPPTNVTLIAPNGHIQVGKGYQPAPKKPFITTNNNQNNIKDIMGESEPINDILYQDNQENNKTQNLIPHISTYEKSSFSDGINNQNAPYSIKVGVFSNNSNIENLRKNISSLGDLQINKVNKQGKILSEVTLNGYQNTNQVYNTIDALGKFGINNPIIIKN